MITGRPIGRPTGKATVQNTADAIRALLYAPGFADDGSNVDGLWSDTRSSDLILPDHEGLLKAIPGGVVPWQGGRVVTNEEANSEDFTAKGTQNATVTANQTAAPNGSVTADLLTEGTLNTGHKVFSEVTPVVGRTYTISVYVKAQSGGRWVYFRGLGVGSNYPVLDLDNGTLSESGSQWISTGVKDCGGGWFRFVGIATASGTSVAEIGLQDNAGHTTDYLGDGVSGVYLWGLQVEDATGQANQNPSEYVSSSVGTKIFNRENGNTVSSGVVTEATGAVISPAPVLVHVPGATNLLTYSEQFDAAAWTKVNATITANSAVAPDGTSTADTLGDNSATGTGGVQVAETGIVVSAGSSVLSVYAKADQLSWIRLEAKNFDTNQTCYYDLGSGATGTSTATSEGIEAVGDGWYRCWMEFATTTDLTGNLFIHLADADNDSTVDLDGTSSVYVWGAQLETGIAATPYIKTEAASASRDTVALQHTLAGYFDETQGTVMINPKMLEASEVEASAVGLFSASGIVASVLYNDSGADGRIASFDLSNVALNDAAWSADDEVVFALTFSGATMTLHRKNITQDTAWTHTDASFDGGFSTSTDLQLFLSNPHQIELLDIEVLGSALTDEQVEARYS